MTNIPVIDNLELLTPFLTFENEGDFYQILILERKKDSNTSYSNKQSCRTIKTYTIYNLEYLEHKYKEIKGLCEYFEARAYINLNRYSDRDIPLRMIEKMVHLIQNSNYKAVGAYDSVVGTLPSKSKKWVIDLDKEHLLRISEIKAKIESLDPQGSKILCEVPTRSGIHLITTPFRKDHFQSWCKEENLSIDILTQNPTVLYVSQSLMEKTI